MPEEKEVVVNEPNTEAVPAAVSESEPAASPSDGASSSEGAPVVAATTEPVYQPNRKFKFTDDNGSEAEAEFDEWVNPYLSQDSEGKFRDLYSKAKAVEFLKSSREKTRQQFDTFQSNVKEVLELKDKDIGIFCDRVGLDRQHLAKWLLTQLEAEEKLKDLPEPLRNMYTEHQELKRRNIELEKQFSNTQNYGLEQATQVLNVQLESILSRPEVSAIASEYDQRRARPGAFFEQVKREGQLEHAITGKDITAGEAVQRALQTLALQVQAPSQGAMPNGSVAAPKVIVQQKAPTIPNVGNGTSAATVKRPRSLDDIRKMAKEMAA